MRCVGYSEARGCIKTGDVLGVHGRNLFAAVTRLVQRLAGLSCANSTHTAVAWWLEGRLYVVEMDGQHNVLRPLSQYILLGNDVDVYACPVKPDNMAQSFSAVTGSPIRYRLVDLVMIGLRLLFGVRTQAAPTDAMVCSSFTAWWLQWAGWVPPGGFPNLPAPAELCHALEPLRKLRIDAKLD